MNHDILQRYIEGNANQQEKEDVAKWLDADDKNMQEFLLLRGIYDTSLWSKSDSISEIQAEEYSIGDNKIKKVSLVRELLKVAAIFLLAIGCYHLFLSKKLGLTAPIKPQTIYAPEGQRAEVLLSDGTHVWLNAKSTLTFSPEFTGNDRIVELNGEAYFEVKHNELKKFIVKTREYQIMVHGTEFNVNSYSDNADFETALIKGSVEVVSNKTNQSIMLSPNERVYAENGRLILTDIANHDQFLWKKGVLSFDNQHVGDIFEKLELYYDVNIEVRNKGILDYQYTGKFWINDGIEHILKVLQLRHNFKYTKDSMNNIIIY